MVKGILGKKLGMTQVIDEDGAFIPVTLIQAGPCVVVQKKTIDNDGYWALQLGMVEAKPMRKPSNPVKGHFKKINIPPTRFLKEIRYKGEPELKVGDKIYADVFEKGETAVLTGTSKGKGFQGVVKRHGFHGGRKSHGSRFHKQTGSIGASADPSRVYKGKKMPGRMGNERVTLKSVKIVEVSRDDNYILVRGSVPGVKGSYVVLRNKYSK